MHKVLISMLALAFVVGCAATSSEGRLQIGGREVPTLVKSSDVIVVGSILGEGGIRNIARDPNDIRREHPTLKVLAQEYRVAIESALKGAVAGTIIVTVARSYQIQGRDPVVADGFVPLDANARYVLFLKRHPFEPTLYAIAFEPSRFKLGTDAVVQSPWSGAASAFPAREAGLFLADVSRAVRAGGN